MQPPSSHIKSSWMLCSTTGTSTCHSPHSAATLSPRHSHRCCCATSPSAPIDPTTSPSSHCQQRCRTPPPHTAPSGFCLQFLHPAGPPPANHQYGHPWHPQAVVWGSFPLPLPAPAADWQAAVTTTTIATTSPSVASRSTCRTARLTCPPRTRVCACSRIQLCCGCECARDPAGTQSKRTLSKCVTWA